MKIVYTVAWNPSKDGIIAVGGYGSNQVYLWDALSGTLIKTFGSAKIDNVFDIAWSPNGERIAVGATNGATIVETSQYAETLTFSYEEGMLTSLAWSPDSSRIALVGNRDAVQLWDANSGKLLAERYLSR